MNQKNISLLKEIDDLKLENNRLKEKNLLLSYKYLFLKGIIRKLDQILDNTDNQIRDFLEIDKKYLELS